MQGTGGAPAGPCVGICPTWGQTQGLSGDVWGNIRAQIGKPCSPHNKWEEKPCGDCKCVLGEEGRVGLQVPKGLIRTNIRDSKHPLQPNDWFASESTRKCLMAGICLLPQTKICEDKGHVNPLRLVAPRGQHLQLLQ